MLRSAKQACLQGMRAATAFNLRKVKKFEVIETTCDLELPNSADDVTLRMICFLS